MKLGTETGSLVNYLMSNTQSIPEVGKGATILLWTDRHAYFVNEVSNDGKMVIIERAKAIREDDLGMSDCQAYRYERDENAQPETLRFLYGKWRIIGYNWAGQQTKQPVNIIFGTMQEYYDYSF